MRYSEYNPWIALVIGIIVLLSGLLKLITNVGGEWHGVYIPAWTGWAFVPLGLLIIILSIRSLRTWKEPEPPAYTDEEIRQAKEKLDQTYLREHGTAPQAPGPAPSPTVTQPTPTPAPPRTLTPEEEARALNVRRKIRQGLLLMLAGVIAFYAAGNLFVLILSPILFMVGLCRAAVGAAQKP